MTSAAVQRTVGRYELLRELGRGATSVVYLARQVDLDRQVAVKELVAFRTADSDATERFLRESRLTGSLSHPNVVTVFEYFEADGTPFIAMEYLERGSLRPLVGSLTQPQVVGVLENVLGGLAHAHGRGIVHRDLKPENLLVTSSGAVKIGDFGIARALESESTLTSSGTTVGTPAYMAPEQVMAGEVGPAADLYAVGAIAYELLSGDVPFHGSNVAMAVMLQHLSEPVPPLAQARPDLDARLCAWVEEMLEKEPSKRPASAEEASDELDEIAIGALGARWRRTSRLDGVARTQTPAMATAATVPVQPPSPTRVEPATPRRRRNVALLVALAAVLAASGVAAAALLTRGGSEASSTARPDSTASQTTRTGETPVITGPVLAGLALATKADGATATLRLTGPALEYKGVVVRDRAIGDGHAWLELEQPGITSRVKHVARGPLAARVRTGKDVVRVDLTSEPGTYESLRIRRPDGHTVVVALAKPAEPTGTTTTQTSPPPASGSNGSTTTPTTPSKPKPPPVKTG